MGGLFLAEAAVQVGTDAAVVGVASDLADVVDVVRQRRQCAGVTRLRDADDPAGLDHPGIHSGADDRTAFDQGFDLVIRQLPVGVDQCAAIVMAGEDRAFEDVQCFPKGLIRQVRGVQQHADGIHRFEQRRSVRFQASLAAGAETIRVFAVMRGA